MRFFCTWVAFLSFSLPSFAFDVTRELFLGWGGPETLEEAQHAARESDDLILTRRYLGFGFEGLARSYREHPLYTGHQVTSLLPELLQDPDVRVRRRALVALAYFRFSSHDSPFSSFDQDELHSSLLAVIGRGDEDRSVRLEALKLMVATLDRGVAPAGVAVLKDLASTGRAPLRGWARQALWKMRPLGKVEGFLSEVRDSLRYGMIFSPHNHFLWMLVDSRVDHDFNQDLLDLDPRLPERQRLQAATSLGAIKYARSFPYKAAEKALRRVAMADPSLQVREAARASLEILVRRPKPSFRQICEIRLLHERTDWELVRTFSAAAAQRLGRWLKRE